MAHPVNPRQSQLFSIRALDDPQNPAPIYQTQLVSLASSVIAVAAIIFGSVLVAKGLLASFIGIPLLLVGGGCIYIAYNTFSLSQNLETLVDRGPRFLPTRLGVIEDLSKNTFLFRWCVALIVQ